MLHSEAVPEQEVLTLHNGARIILRPDPATHVTAVHAMVKAGAAKHGLIAVVSAVIATPPMRCLFFIRY